LSFKDIIFPIPPKIDKNGEMIPLEFYGTVIPNSIKIQFKLGYFSTNAISILAPGFAKFIYNNGVAEFVINQFLNTKDYELLTDENLIEQDFMLIESKVTDLNELNILLSSKNHFFNCLKYLIKEERIKIIPVTCSDGSMSHYKEAIFTDEENNKIYINGSCNFTEAGILDNGESFLVHRSWKSEDDKLLIEKEQIQFDRLFSMSDTENFIYLKKENIIKVINEKGVEKNLQELLHDEEVIRNKIINRERISKVQYEQEKKLIEEINQLINQPSFPYKSPLEYQKKAYYNWEQNSYKGLFAMATGTGKTLTALYCLIEECKKNKIQKNVFIVPGEELVRQWGSEIKNCNFKNVYLWYSGNKNLKKDIEDIEVLKNSTRINIVVTYDSFHKLLKIIRRNISDFTFVFDEANNIGAKMFKSSIENIEFNRLIGLSATPLRLWDEGDENKFIEQLFNSEPPYTFSISMKEAIEQKYLCQYNYYPSFIYLEDDEFEDYLYWTKLIPLAGDNEINSNAAIKRQSILDSAKNKNFAVTKIVNELIKTDSFKYTLVYCPKGKSDVEGEERYIHILGEEVANKFKLNVQFFVGETEGRETLLMEFAEGKVDMLFAIKCLDEGVNIPNAKNAIFVASGKNYREFVQRRGRILRTAVGKSVANIYDIIVLPTINQYRKNKETSEKLIISEFRRAFEFSSLALFDQERFWKIEEELKRYNLTQYYLMSKLD